MARTLIFYAFIREVEALSGLLPADTIKVCSRTKPAGREAAVSKFRDNPNAVMISDTSMAVGWRAPHDTTVLLTDGVMDCWDTASIKQALARRSGV